MKGIGTNLLVYLISFNGVNCFTNYTDKYTYDEPYSEKPPFVFPKPKEELLKPYGFKISIPDDPGIQSVSFSGVINLDLYVDVDNLRTGQFFSKLSEPNLPDEWALENKSELKFGDHVYYSMYITKGGIQYTMEHFFFGVAFYEGNLVIV